MAATSLSDRIVSRLKLRQLRLLESVARHGSILAASREMNLSQPAATKMIQDLELDFGVELFLRTNRGVAPTIYGEVLLRHGKVMMAQMSHAVQELEDLTEGKGGRVVVGTLLAASARLLPLAIEKLLADRPNLAIRVVEGTNEVLMPALRAGDLDMVVGRLPVHRHRTDLDQAVVYDERIVAVVRPGHPLADVSDLAPTHLAAFGWVMPPPETTLRRQLDQLFVSAGAAPDHVVESVSYLTNRALVQSTDMIWPLPSQAVEQDVSAKALACLKWTCPVGTGPVGVSYRSDAQLSPAARALIDRLREVSSGL